MPICTTVAIEIAVFELFRVNRNIHRALGFDAECNGVLARRPQMILLVLSLSVPSRVKSLVRDSP